VAWDSTKGRPEPIRSLNRIREIENGEPLVNIVECVPRIRVTRPATIHYLRQSVAEMLAVAARSLPDGLRFAVGDCFRTLARQQRIYDFMYKSAKEVFPDRSHAAIRRTICRWIAPTDQKAPPGHCTGAAIDLNIEDLDGNELDVWSPYERLAGAPTYVFGLTPQAQTNRDLLVNTMLGAGFSNCRDEWWHYSYGDAGWAVRVGSETCCYGLVHLDPSIVEGHEQLHIASMEGRENPFYKFPKR
jgi:D-alanyl-D-alanine dipeptidase